MTKEGNLQRSKQFTKKKVDDYRVSLETTVVSGDESATTSQMYHITKQLATGLAQSESRDSATTEEARKSLTSAEVVLAFPLQSDYQPHISTRRQELFAFLPFRTSDYKVSSIRVSTSTLEVS
jgi:RNase H-fold protein (predicted Holliday junction resolvase)